MKQKTLPEIQPAEGGNYYYAVERFARFKSRFWLIAGDTDYCKPAAPESNNVARYRHRTDGSAAVSARDDPAARCPAVTTGESNRQT